MRSMMRYAARSVAAMLGLALVGGPLAAPYIPADDAQVLERLPERTTPQYRELKRLQAQAKAAPGDPAVAVALADANYRLARSEGDPRYLGYAQAALAPWWNEAAAPTSVLVTRATILQSNHAFARALTDLDAALAREPRHARALLMRATVLTVQGKYAAARLDCARLFGVALELYVIDCLAAIDGLTGNARPAIASLERALTTLPAISDDGRGWTGSLLGEIRHRLDDPLAEKNFRAALAADPRDLYTLGAYSDWLLDNGRAAEVIPLVRDDPRVDALLLRLALAQQALRSPEATATVATLRARFAASRARGDTVHRREEARFELELNNDARSALRLAQENWAVQREPADLRILAQAGAAANDAGALQTVRAWLAETGLEYPRVARLVPSAGTKTP